MTAAAFAAMLRQAAAGTDSGRDGAERRATGSGR
jgi:hypothetical protein